MKGYWHIAAFSAATVIFTKLFNSMLPIILFCLWLAVLLASRRVPLTPVLVALPVLFIFHHILPSEQYREHFFGSKEKAAAHTGVIMSAIEVGAKKTSFSFKLDEDGQKVLAIHFPDDVQAASETLRHGARCTFHGVLERPGNATNPGEFDFARHLQRRGFEKQLIIDRLESASCTGGSTWASLLSARGSLLHLADEQLSSFTSSWLKALVLGDDGGLPDEEIELFQRWSLSHLLAISGLHIGLVSAILYYIFAATGLFTKEKAQWAIVFLLPFYAFLAGGQPSVWRASLMTVLVVLLYKFKASIKTSDMISIVFLLLLLLSPSMMNNVGFQLSFTVSFGIILSQRWLSSADSFFVTMLRLGFVSQMMILPLQIAYFHQLQPLSIILNMLVVPYFSFFVIPAMFVLFLLLLIPPAGPLITLIDRIFGLIHPHAVDFVSFVDTYFDYPLMPGDRFTTFAPLYLFLFILFMHYLQAQRQIKAFTAGTAMVGVLVFSALAPYLSSEGRVTMLDIGQGDAFIIELPYRKGVLFIDAGSSFSFETMQPSAKVYKQVIGPYLKHRGIRNIDAVFISHEDLDHDGSLPFMAEEVSIGKVIASELYKPPMHVMEMMKEHRIPLERMKTGEGRRFDGASFHAIGPLAETDSANENSLILHAKVGGKSWLFTGDAGHPSEKLLLDAYPSLTVDILKVGHHGSKNSSAAPFVQGLSPQYALVSAGRNNRYGHPAPEVLDVLEQHHVRTFRTDESGAVTYRFRKTGSGTFLPFRP